VHYRLENHIGAGVKLGTTGVDFDQRLISLGPNAAVRFAGAATFPRQIPVPRGEKMLDWQFDRLGVARHIMCHVHVSLMY